MMERDLQSLTIRIRTKQADDVSLIFAEPSTKDMETVVSDNYLIILLRSLLWPEEEKEVTLLQCPEERVEVKLETEAGNLVLIRAGAGKQIHTPDDVMDDDDEEDEPNEPGDDYGNQTDLENDEDEEENKDEIDEKKNEENQEEKKEKITRTRTRGQKALNKTRTNIKDLLKLIEKIDDDEYLCIMCSKVWPSELNARKHVREHDLDPSAEKERACQHCSKIFSSQVLHRLHDHQGCSLQREVHCGACKEEFASVSLLELHIKSAHKDGFQCDFCEYVTDVLGHKILHEKRLHLNMDCKSCTKVFQSNDEKISHFCAHPDRFQCDQCEKNYKVKGELKKHIDSIHRGIRFPCSTCSEVLSSSQSLKRHVRTVHETVFKNYRCDICSKAFKDNEYLLRHMKIHEENTKSFVCQECGKFFKYKVTLRSHIRTMHDKIFKQTCEECGKSFADMHKLKVHGEMAHMKGEVYMCQVCGKEMIGKNRLRNHMMTHPKGQKFVSCEQCGKEVAETQLRSHIVAAHKMHSYKYPCQFCPKRLDTKAHIRAHIRKHTGGRPYLCRGCGKYYPLLETAQKHTRIFHNGDYSLIFYDIQKDINNPYVNGN